MSALLGKIAQTATKIIHSREVRHDAALFVGALAATGLIGNIAGGAPLSWDVLSAAIIVAVRRAAVLRLAGK